MKRIVIIPNITKDPDLSVTKKLIGILSGRAELVMSRDFCEKVKDVSFVDSENLFNSCDHVITLGGDGTILNAAVPSAKMGIPVMGINLGRIGFMAEVNVSDMERAADALLSGKYNIEKRMMLEIGIIKNGVETKRYSALNDIVISKSSSPMIHAEIYRRKEKINAYTADGLIISTPTGSTGYSLSAGGPVCDPTMELFIASPICAHMLHARPAVIPCETPITLSIAKDISDDALVTVDGETKESISSGDLVEVRRSGYYMNLIKFGHQSFYDVLIDKLK